MPIMFNAQEGAKMNALQVAEIPLGTVVYDKPVTHYQRVISTMKAAQGFDPRHIEGYMRLQHDILSRLSKQQFAREVRLCVMCIQEGGIEAAERNAQSFGL